MIRPSLRAKYQVEHVPGQGVFLLSETESHLLEGVHAERVVSLVDGVRTVPEIVALAQPTMSANDVHAALEALRLAGHLVEADTQLPAVFASFWSELEIDPVKLAAILQTTLVELTVHGDVQPFAFTQAAAAFGLSLGGPGTIHVALTDDYQQPGLQEVNRSCLARGIPLLMVKPTGVKLWVGPLVVPGRTACWRCLELRLDNNREVENFILRRTGRPGPLPVARARVGLIEQQAAVMAVTQLLRSLAAGGNSALESRLLIADVSTFSFDFHEVVRRPQCVDCGEPGLSGVAGRPVTLSSVPSSHGKQAGTRSESAEHTYQRLSRHISPVTGIVKSVMPSMWHGAGPLRVYVAGHNFALKSDELYFLKDSLRTHSSGKGRSDAQARVSALCEALERFSGVFRGDEPRMAATFGELGGDAVDPRLSMLFSEQQYRDREQWLARGSRFQVVPLPFDEDARIEWTPVWSMTQERRRFLPTSYLYYNYPAPPDQFFCWADSNGAAAGTSFEEALLQGLLELVERDAVAIWWYNRLPCTGVDIASFDEAYNEELEIFYKEHGREFWALDLTTDIGVPAFVAISRRREGPTEDIMMGFGAHPDAQVALSRALTEMNQFMPAVLNVLPDGTTAYGVGDHDAVHWWRTATLQNQPYLSPAGGVLRTPADYSRCHVDDAGAAARDLIARLEELGHEVLVLDQTRPETGLPVVKAIVPGLRHFWARFAPGRLYDVPLLRDGRVKKLAEGQLNPTAMFL